MSVVGMLDSGLGGLSVLVPLRSLLPDADILYVADRARAPYGPRPLEEVRRFAVEITGHLLDRGAEVVVVACNAASAAALEHLREIHPSVPIVGMEPAVKPAAAATRRGVIGVLTTQATFQSRLLASVVDRFAADATVIARVCDGWVELVERGSVAGPSARAEVARHVVPLLEAGADTLVLGCTHFPFLAPLIADVAGPGVTIVDPSGAVARQTARVCGLNGVGGGAGTTVIETTGPVEGVAAIVEELTGLAFDVRGVTFAASP